MLEINEKMGAENVCAFYTIPAHFLVQSILDSSAQFF